MSGNLTSNIDLAITQLTGVGDSLEALGKQDSQHRLMSPSACCSNAGPR